MMIFDINNRHAEDKVELVIEEEGPFEATFLTPENRLPVIVSGSLRETELALLAQRKNLEVIREDHNAAISSGNAEALERSLGRTREALDAWWELELKFASMLLQRGIPLKGRSMITVKR